MNNIRDFIMNQDLSPCLIGLLRDAQSVGIVLFDSDGMEISIEDRNCRQILDTGRWSWSTINLPTGICGPITYNMIADNGEVFEGDFIVPKEGNDVG